MYDRDHDAGVGFATGILTGAMVGAGLALLFAPKAGSALREDIRESAGSLRDAIARQYREIADRAGVEIDNLQDRAEQAAASIEASAREWVDSAAQRVKNVERASHHRG